MSSKILILAAGLFAFAPLAPTAYAEDQVFTFVVKKQEEKKKTRWTLAEWLETRDRMRLMDMWLAMNSPSPYEFFLGFDKQLSAGNQGFGSVAGWRANIGAYANVVGLELERDSHFLPEWNALFGLRFFGYHVQATHIRLLMGLRNRFQDDEYRNFLMGGHFTFYLGKFLGLDFDYRHYFEGTVSLNTRDHFSGNRYEIGAFIEYEFLRLYGLYFSETEQGLATAARLQTGTQFGVRLFF
jgi:hypothetical protein